MSEDRIGLFEAKSRLSELVARAESGQAFIITRHNKPVARLVPVVDAAEVDLERRLQALEALQDIGRRIRASGGGWTAEEIVRWKREDAEERTLRQVRAAAGDP